MSGKAHKFKVGQRVNFAAPGARGGFSIPRYTVVRLLPRVGNNLSYRIKGDDEPHERVADEAALTAAF